MKTYQEFCEAVRIRESSNNYLAENSLGYLGAYQFGMARLCDFKITRRKVATSKSFANEAFEFIPPITKNEFLHSPILQDKVFAEHVQDYKKKIPFHMGKDVSEFDVFGIIPTMSGCIGVCHLLGLGGLRKLLAYNIDEKDANGTKASDYLKLFNDYEII